MEYPDNTVGSLMSTDYYGFNQNLNTQQAIDELRRIKPESNTIYYLYVLDDGNRLIATVSLRDLVVADPNTKLKEIMNTKVTKVKDYDKIDSLAETISKYNLLAIPVVNDDSKMEGIVIIDDVIFTLLKTKKKMTLRED
jgi:Mg/Co/Ni transporter MgtE